MSSDSSKNPTAPAEAEQAGTYEPPTVVVLGTFSELTQQGNTPDNELLNDGSQV